MGHIVDGVSILEEASRKGVAEAVRSGLLFERASGVERVRHTTAPDVGDGLEPC
jgi:hypothetical protein